MKLIVGLGNPGPKYKGTRHNVGFRVIDELKKKKPPGVVLAKPKTFMNQSGKAIKEMINYYKLKPENLWIIHDDVDVPLGEFKSSRGRGSAGHKGVQSIINELNTKDFNRIRIGICPKFGKPKNVEDFVLQKFGEEEKAIFNDVTKKILQEIKILNN